MRVDLSRGHKGEEEKDRHSGGTGPTLAATKEEGE